MTFWLKALGFVLLVYGSYRVMRAVVLLAQDPEDKPW